MLRRKIGRPKTAIVTGSSRRVGYHIAKALSNNGWQVVIHGRDEKHTLDAKRKSGAVGAVVGDLCDPDTYLQMRKACEIFFDGKLGLLVNSASTFVQDGENLTDRWTGFSDSLWQAHWVYCLTYELADPLNEAGGLVVNLTDLARSMEWKSFVAHGAAKTCIESMGPHLQNNLRRKKGLDIISLRLPTVLPPDRLGEVDSKYGPEASLQSVSDGIMILEDLKMLNSVAELQSDGNIKWV